jgi:hypothetical protein
LQIGKAKGENVEILVAPDREGSDPRIAGVLGLDVLSADDVELDLAHNKLRLFSPDHCPHGVVYWSTSLAVAEIPLSFQPTGALQIDVMLDGKNLHAALKPDAPSYMDMHVAHDVFGLYSDSPGMTQVSVSSSDPEVTAYRYKFKSLTLSGMSVTDPNILVVGSPGAMCEARAHCFGNADLWIGASILKKLHLYFSFKEKILYATAADETPPVPSPPTPPSAASKPAGSL